MIEVCYKVCGDFYAKLAAVELYLVSGLRVYEEDFKGSLAFVTADNFDKVSPEGGVQHRRRNIDGKALEKILRNITKQRYL